MTEALLDAGRQTEAVRLFVRQGARFLHTDWPAWQAHIDGRIDRIESTLDKHISHEQELPAQVKAISERHEDDMAALRKMLTGTEGAWDYVHHESPVGVIHRIRHCLDRIRMVGKWVVGVFTSVLLLALGVLVTQWMR